MKKKVQQTARVLFSFYFLAKEKQLLPHSKALNFCLFLFFCCQFAYANSFLFIAIDLRFVHFTDTKFQLENDAYFVFDNTG